MSRQIFAAIAVLALAGCATSGSNSYYYDRDGDYYSGTSAGVVTNPGVRYYGAVDYGYGYGYGAGGYGPGLWGGYGWGGGYSYYPWYYSTPIWSAPHVHENRATARQMRVERDRSGRSGFAERPDRAPIQARSAPQSDWRGHMTPQRNSSPRREASRSSGFAPAPSQRAPAQRFDSPQRPSRDSGFAPQQRSAPSVRTQSAPQRSVPPARSTAPVTRND